MGEVHVIGDRAAEEMLHADVRESFRMRIEYAEPPLETLLADLSKYPVAYREPFSDYVHALRLIHRGEYEDARSLLKRVQQAFAPVSTFGAALARREDLRLAIQMYGEHIDPSEIEGLLQTLEACGDSLVRSVTYRTWAILARNNDDIDQALALARRSIETWPDNTPDGIKVESLTSLCQFLFPLGQHDEAKRVLEEVLAIAEASDSMYLLLDTMDTYCVSAFWRGDYVDLILYARRLQDLAHPSESARFLGKADEYLAMAYGLLGDYTTAIGHMERAITTYKASGYRMAEPYGNLGALYEESGDHERALEFARVALGLSRARQDDSHAQRQRINILLSLAQLDRREEFVELHATFDSTRATDANDLVDYHYALGIHSNNLGDLDGAESELLTASRIMESNNVEVRRVHVYGALKDLYLAKNDLQNYVKYNDLYHTFKEERIGAEAARRASLIEREHEMKAIEQERQQERAVLYSTLPKHVADRVIRGEQVTDHFDQASVLFLDIVGFTAISDRIPAGQVVHLLDAIFAVCDDVCQQHGLTKVKTIGDSYLAVCGVPEPIVDHAQRTAQAAVVMMRALEHLKITMPPELGDTSWVSDIGDVHVRIGLHCGPVVAGVVGRERLQYDVWGDTVNTASRMESTGEPGRIQVSAEFHKQLSSRAPSNCRTVERGIIDIKGKGSMTTYWLERTL